MVNVVLIAKTQVNWQPLLLVAKKVLGRSISVGVDAKNQQVGDLRSYLAVLGELEIEGTDPDEVLRFPGSLLRNIQYSFLVHTSTDLRVDVIAESDLKVTGENMLFVVSGNLEQWRTAILNGCTQRAKKQVRLFYDHCLIWFKQEGLGAIWQAYTETMLPDNTFKLEFKK